MKNEWDLSDTTVYTTSLQPYSGWFDKGAGVPYFSEFLAFSTSHFVICCTPVSAVIVNMYLSLWHHDTFNSLPSSILKTISNPHLRQSVPLGYLQTVSRSWPGPDTILHLFSHTLIIVYYTHCISLYQMSKTNEKGKCGDCCPVVAKLAVWVSNSFKNETVSRHSSSERQNVTLFQNESIKTLTKAKRYLAPERNNIKTLS